MWDLNKFLIDNGFTLNEKFGNASVGYHSEMENPEGLQCVIDVDYDVDMGVTLSTKKKITFSIGPKNFGKILLSYGSGVYNWTLDQNFSYEDLKNIAKNSLENSLFPNEKSNNNFWIISGEVDEKRYEVLVKLTKEHSKYSRLKLKVSAENYFDIENQFRTFLFSLWDGTSRFRDDSKYSDFVKNIPFCSYKTLISRRLEEELDKVPF